jgi:hypothetical protein
MTTLYEPIADVVGLSAFVYQHTGLGHFINFTPDVASSDKMRKIK